MVPVVRRGRDDDGGASDPGGGSDLREVRGAGRTVRGGGSMIRATLLAAILAVGAIATAQAAQWTRNPDGSLSCPGSYPAIGARGQTIIVCPPDPISKQQADEYDRGWLKAREAEEARQEADRITRRCKELPRPSFCK
jgi:hypothetical protein